MANAEKLAKIIEPFQIRNVKLKNRMVKAPFSSVTADKDGFITDSGISFYGAIARGGVGLSISESCAIDPLGVSGSPRLQIWDDKFIPALAKLTKAIHQYDCPVFSQLHHAGPAHSMGAYGGQAGQATTPVQPVASSSLTKEELPGPVANLPRGLTIPEIQEIVQKFVKAALRAREAGFDGAELHFAHTYLVNSFFSRAWNTRQDAYGGELKNRARIAVEIVQAIRKSVGEDFVIGARMNGAEYGPAKGLTSEETQGIAVMLKEAGIDYLSVTAWGFGPYELALFPEQLQYPELKPEVMHLVKKINKPGALVEPAAAIKKATSLPVIAVGRLDPKLGEWILKNGKADLIAMSRRLIADGEIPNKVAAGRLDDIAPCTACIGCWSNFAKGIPVRCRINPGFGREQEYEIKPAVKKKKVMVIGGGPAGMEAARVAALRGHEVSLYDRNPKLGGLLPLASMIKGTEIEDIPLLIQYMNRQIVKAGVKVEPGKEVTPSLVEQVKPDAVIVAVGGIFGNAQIPGSDRRNVVTSADLHKRVKRALRFFGPGLVRSLTKLWLPVGKRVVIVGGLIHGCETAEFLIKRGRKVAIVESSDQLGTGVPETNRLRLLRWFGEKGVTMLTGVKYNEITDKGIVITTREGEKRTIEADAVLITTPPLPNHELYKALQGKVLEVYMIGDCKEPRLIVDAIEEGSVAGRTV